MKLGNSSVNGFSLRQLFCLVCCPPVPSRIAAKIAFKPPTPSYSFFKDTMNRFYITFAENDVPISEREREKMDCFFATTTRGNKLACVYIKCIPNARFTILFSHGNASDIGLMFPFFMDLCNHIRCNIFGYDYSGYGASSGKPSEKNMYADIECAWNVLTRIYNVRPDHIILYGQSLGTVPTVDLASRLRVGAVVLHSPLLSALRVIYPEIKRTWCCDTFLNIEKVANITSPVLVIHGENDETVPFSHGLTVFEKCSCPVNPLWVLGAGHNTVECHSEYLERLKFFVTTELDTITQQKIARNCNKLTTVPENTRHN